MKTAKVHNVYFLLVLAIPGIFSSLKSQNFAYTGIGCFNTPQQQAFLETYITIVGNTLAFKEVQSGYQNSVKVSIKVTCDTGIVLQHSYNVLGPAFSNSISAPSFIDVQRYAIKNGNYSIQITLEDNNNMLRKPCNYRSNIKVNYQPYKLQVSSIELVERYQKSELRNTLNKSGFELVPYTVNYFPESVSQLNFYFETYNCDIVLGRDKFLVYNYYLENAQTLKPLNEFGAFKKQKTSAVNPLLAKLDISKLSSGAYNLVIELKDENNLIHVQEKIMFQRMNRFSSEISPMAITDRNSFESFFQNRKDPDSLKMFVECLWPIADGLDKERVINQTVKKDPELMKNFVVDFWNRRAADTANPYTMWKTYYQSVLETMVLFRCGKQKGYNGDRGRVYLQYGKPNQRSIQNNEANTYPYEIWQYYRTTDASTGRFYSNRKFVFVNHAIADDCHQLIHSDMPGEFNNPRWQFEITRRNNDGKANLDNTTPAGTENNQFNEIYSNPR